jgi:glutaminase
MREKRKKEANFDQESSKRLNALMQTCGFMMSHEFTYKVGLPGKSGIGGGIVALFPKILW